MTKKAVILARVSSTEQEYGKSLDAQEIQGIMYAQNKNMDIIGKPYRIIESSTKGNRKEFTEMMNFIKAQREVVALVAHAVDRFQRRFNESVELLPLIEQGKLELHFVSNNLIIHKDSPPSDLMMWDFNVVAARAYALQIKVNTKRGLQQKIDEGEWPTLAPLGYLNYKEGKKKLIKLDPDRAPLIKRLFEEYSTGTYTIGEMYRRMKKLGLRHRQPEGKTGALVSRNTIYRILENPFYCGTMIVTRFGETKRVKHHYDTLITEGLFKRCEDIRLGRRHKPFKYGNHRFIFRGLIKCACGRLLSPYLRKNKYIYLKCSKYETNCNNSPIVEQTALNAVENAFNNIKIDEELAKLMKNYLEGKNKTDHKEKQHETVSIEKSLTLVKNKLDKLINMHLNDLLSEDDFKEAKQKLEIEKRALENRKAEPSVNEHEFNLALDDVLYFARNGVEMFKS